MQPDDQFQVRDDDFPSVLIETANSENSREREVWITKSRGDYGFL